GRVEGAGRRGVDDVGGDDRVLGVLEEALQLALGGLLEGGVDLFLGDLAAQLDDQVGDRAGGDRDAHRDAVQLALELRQHQRGGLRGTGGGGDDVLGGGTRATQVLVREVQDPLVVGVGVH